MQYPDDSHISEDVRLSLQQTEKYIKDLLSLTDSPSQEFITSYLGAIHNLHMVESVLRLEGIQREAEDV